MTLVRHLALTLTACALVISQAQAASLHPPALSPNAILHQVLAERDDGAQDEDAQARDRGVVQGEIVGVDFERGILHLQTQRGRVDVQILPSTSILRRGQYGTIADLTQGAHVSVNVSEVGGRLVAQIIRMR
jgi:hypothetical protein